jgi:hypothetical protein
MAKTSATLSVIPRGPGSPAAPDADLVDAVLNFLEAKLAPLREKLLLQDAEIKHLKTELDALPEPQPGRDGLPGLPGRDGLPGAPGKDGLGFDNLTVEHDGERLITIKLTNGERMKSFPIKLPCMIYREICKPETAYEKGDCVTFGGSVWTALRDTTEKPGDGCKDWRLSAKRGRDARHGKSAYEVSGFQGSEAEWLRSLRGPPGKDGRGFTP